MCPPRVGLTQGAAVRHEARLGVVTSDALPLTLCGPDLQAMLKEGHKHLVGLDEAVLKNIEACKQLSAILKTSMGPNGAPCWHALACLSAAASHRLSVPRAQVSAC